MTGALRTPGNPGAERMWRYGSLEWAWTAVTLILCALSLVLPGIAAASVFRAFGSVGLALFAPFGFFVFLASLVVVAGCARSCLPGVNAGSYPLRRHPELTKWLLQYSMHNILRLPGWLTLIQSNPLSRWLYRRLFCASIHPSVRASADSIMLDPYLVTIGEGSKIGAFVKFVGHYSDDEKFVIGEIRIGRNVLIGGESIIGPDVSIGDGAAVEGRSGVLPGTAIPAGEVWGGTPARFRRLRSGAGELA